MAFSVVSALDGHCGEDMNDGSCARSGTGGRRRCSLVGRNGGLRLASACAHPHMPRRRKSMQAAPGRRRQRLAESRPAQQLRTEPQCRWMGSRDIVLWRCSSRSFFWDCSLDRPGVDLDVEFCRTSFASSRARNGLAWDQLLPAKTPGPRPRTLWGTAGTGLLRRPVPQSRHHRSSPWPGSRSAWTRRTRRRPRSPTRFRRRHDAASRI